MLELNAEGQTSFDALVALAVLATVAVAVRLLCKLRTKTGIQADDYWILAALSCYCVAVAFGIWGLVITGGGEHGVVGVLAVLKQDPAALKIMSTYLESILLAYTFAITSVYCVKMSILMFYWRIFFVTSGYKRISVSLIAISTAHFIAIQVANLLTCIPLNAFWDRSKSGRCYNYNEMYLGMGLVDLFIDAAILALPIRMAFKLQLPTRTKIAVASIFALGGFVVVAQIMRIVYVYHPNSRWIKHPEAEQWTNIHDATAIVCACLPLYKPVWSPISNAVGRYASSIKSRIGRSRSDRQPDFYPHNMERLPGSERELGQNTKYVASTKKEASVIFPRNESMV
ncbi:unnamed protein product [Periconia digitata]|uniref:Rhodopsin domain-containing protein n=1 Tax=Periconia digitata TaxID=1303443 RepID=A0A9W4XW36_9PLEO|nr:unnamed protein product [Periconia digitata]